MLRRNLSVKEAPQRWQENAADGVFDVIFTFEGRVFDMVIEGIYSVTASDVLLFMIYFVEHGHYNINMQTCKIET